MTQHLILTGRSALTGPDGRMLTACGRRVGPESGTSWQQATCRACRASVAWQEASEQ